MTQDEAKRLIVQEWRHLPREKRESQADRHIFAAQAMQLYRLTSAADRLQVIRAWLENDLRIWPD
jgi:hypothetical protein